MLRPFELSPEPGSLSNPLPPDRMCFPCDPEWKCPPSLCRQHVKCGRTGPYWDPVAPHDSHMKSCTAAAQLHWRGGWRPWVADHIVDSSSCASNKCLPTSLSLNCSEEGLIDVTLHVSTMRSGRPSELLQARGGCTCAPSVTDETAVALGGDEDILELCHRRITGTRIRKKTGPGDRVEGKEELLPEGMHLCVYFDPAVIFICFSHILFTASLSQRCFKLDGARKPFPRLLSCPQAMVFNQCEMYNHAMLKCNWNKLRQINKLKGTACIWNALCHGFLTCLQTANSQGKQKVAVFTQFQFGAC